MLSTLVTVIHSNIKAVEETQHKHKIENERMNNMDCTGAIDYGMALQFLKARR
jgi:hypothetical protein